jgi:predicted PurR-regulated permease PerM
VTEPHESDGSGELVEAPVTHVSTNATIAVLTAAILLLYFVREILLPFVISGIIAYVCSPFVDRISLRARIPRGAAAFATGVVLAAIAVAVAWLGMPLLLREVRYAVLELGDLRSFVHQWIGASTVSLFGKQITDVEIASSISGAVQAWVNRSGGIAVLAAVGFTGAFGLLLTWVLLFYFLIGGKTVGRGIVWLIPPLDRPLVAHIWQNLDPVLRRYFVGLAIVVVYACTAAYAGLGLILHAPHAAILAVLTGVLELVPIAGPLASAVVAGVFTLHGGGGVAAVLGYVAYATALRISIDQFIGPIVLGRAARLQPSVVIFCFLAGAILFGIPGVILAVPVALTIKVTVGVLYDEPIGSGKKCAIQGEVP